MKNWEGSEHPRDKGNGRFIKKEIGTFENEEDIKEADIKESNIEKIKKVFEARRVETNKSKSYNNNKLPKIVFARFNKRLAAIKHGEHYKKTSDGNYSVVIDGDDGFLYDIEFIGDISYSQIVGYQKINYDKTGRDNLEIKEIKDNYESK